MKLSDNAQQWMKKLGQFSITKKGDEIKGYTLPDCDKVYWNASDLRNLSAAANEVAAILKGNLTPVVADASRCTFETGEHYYLTKEYCVFCGYEAPLN